MKFKIVFSAVMLLAVFALQSCQLELSDVQPKNTGIENVENSIDEDNRFNRPTGKGEIGCIIRQGDDEACFGIMCGDTGGGCGKGVSDHCECLDPQATGSYSGADFKEKWNSEDGRKELMEEGYYSETLD